MIRRITVLATAVLLIVGACSASEPAPASPPPPASTLRPGPTGTPVPTPSPTPAPAQAGYLTQHGSDLFLAGVPFTEISFNKFDLLQQFVVPPGEAWGDNGPDSRSAAREALRILGEKGFRVVRVNASPFYPSWFDEAFFDDDPGLQAEERRAFFAGFDAMLDACDQRGIRIVASLLWNWENLADLGHHSLREGLENRESLGRIRVEEYVSEVVARYRDRPTITMWEIGNEWNLGADLQLPNGIIPGDARGDGLHPGPLVRDARNNFTSDQLATFYREMATLIRSLDSRHLITTGNSAPRPSAMHLLRAAWAGDPVDWTLDDEEEQMDYLRLINPDPIDVISIHYSDDAMTALGGALDSPENLRFFADAAADSGKPLFVGEIGYDANVRRYDTQAALDMLRATLPVLVELRLPLTLYWTFNDDRRIPEDGKFSLRYGATDEALRLIEDANASLNR